MKRILIFLLIIGFAASNFGEENTQKANDNHIFKFEVIRQVDLDSVNRSLTGEIKINFKIDNVGERFVMPINLQSETLSSFLFTRNDKNCITTIKCPSAIKIVYLLRSVSHKERAEDYVAQNVEAAGQIEIIKVSDNLYNLRIDFFHLATKYNIILTSEFDFANSWSDKDPFPIVTGEQFPTVTKAESHSQSAP